MLDHPPIQIVNEEDEPIGSMHIAEAHKRGAIHRVVRIMVENPDNHKILLQKRSPKMETWPNAWDNSAAGHVDVGEDYYEAALRELEEEVGIKADKLTEIGSYYTENTTPEGVKLKRFNKVYKYYTKESNFNVQQSEVAEVRWFDVAEVKQMIKDVPGLMTDGSKYVIEKYYE